MQYSGKMLAKDMVEGKEYYIHQGQGYCDLVAISRKGFNFTFKHLNEVNGHLVSVDGQLINIHKDIIPASPFTNSYRFETITLDELYAVQMEVYHLHMGGGKLPSKYARMITVVG